MRGIRYGLMRYQLRSHICNHLCFNKLVIYPKMPVQSLKWFQLPPDVSNWRTVLPLLLLSRTGYCFRGVCIPPLASFHLWHSCFTLLIIGWLVGWLVVDSASRSRSIQKQLEKYSSIKSMVGFLPPLLPPLQLPRYVRTNVSPANHYGFMIVTSISDGTTASRVK